MSNPVIPLQREINRTKRQLDDAEWEGLYCEHLKKHLESLLKQMEEGETWYANF